MGAKNKVIAGDYAGANVTLVNGQVTLAISLGHMIILNKKMAADHAVKSEDPRPSRNGSTASCRCDRLRRASFRPFRH